MYTNPSTHFSYFYGAAYLGNGLYIYSRGAKPFSASDYANWYFNAPGTSRIVRADFSYVKHEPQTTGSWPAPYNDDRIYQGVWSYTQNRYEIGHVVRAGRGGRGLWALRRTRTYAALNYNSKSHSTSRARPATRRSSARRSTTPATTRTSRASSAARDLHRGRRAPPR